MTMWLDIDSDDQTIIDLCERYWEFQDEKFIETIEQIEATNPSGTSVYKIVSKHCFACSTEFNCSSCGKPFIFKNRTEFNRLYGKVDHVDWVCANCIETNKNDFEEAKRNKLVASFEEAKKFPLDIESLSVRQAVLIRALILHSSTEDMGYIDAFSRGQIEPFSPVQDFSIELIREMYHSSLICIHPNINLELLEFSDDLTYRFTLDQVPWKLNLGNDMSMIEFSKLLIEKISSPEYIDNDPEGVKALCFEISLKECIAYLEVVVEEYSFNFKVGPKTLEALNKALAHFSVAQVYNFIWRAGKDSAAYYQRARVSRFQAANSIVGSIDRSVDQALVNKWDVKPFRRNYDMPQSVISKVVFNHLLHTDDGGFHQPIKSLL